MTFSPDYIALCRRIGWKKPPHRLYQRGDWFWRGSDIHPQLDDDWNPDKHENGSLFWLPRLDDWLEIFEWKLKNPVWVGYATRVGKPGWAMYRTHNGGMTGVFDSLDNHIWHPDPLCACALAWLALKKEKADA